jgi:hypothetical protein
MNNKFAIRRTPVCWGKKTKLELYHDGVLIGSRTSARAYKFATVVCRSQDAVRQYLIRQAEYYRKEAVRLNAIINDAPGAREKEIRFHAAAHDREFQRKALENGDFVTWAKRAQQNAIECDAEALRLATPNLPEFNVLSVFSWNSKATNLPHYATLQRIVEIVSLDDLVNNNAVI